MTTSMSSLSSLSVRVVDLQQHVDQRRRILGADDAHVRVALFDHILPLAHPLHSRYLRDREEDGHEDADAAHDREDREYPA